MVSYLFGGDTGETPESIRRKREIANALVARDLGSSPKNVGEGLSAIGKALIYRQMMGKADAAEKTGASKADEAFNAIFGSGSDIPAPEAAAEIDSTTPDATASAAPIDMTGNDVFTEFMDTVKGSVTNPYGLAAIAATGKAESQFDPKNVNRTWSDPSESGKPGTAGGIMSWRGSRYDALSGTGDLSPKGQAKFFLGENPQLIEALNNAKSVEEAQKLMNNAWAFAGYNRPGGESARRLSYAKALLPNFQGGTEIASASPQTATDAIAAQSAPSGYVDPMVSAQPAAPSLNYAALPASGPMPNAAPRSPEMMPNVTVRGDRLPVPQMDPARMAPGGMPMVNGAEGLPAAMAPPAPQQAAQAPMPAQPAPMPQQQVQAPQTAPSQAQAMTPPRIDPRLVQVLANPYLSPEKKAMAQSMLQQQMAEVQAYREMQIKQADPAYKLQMEKSQLELDQLRNPGTEWVRLDDDTILNKSTGETKETAATAGQPGAFRFGGNSVEAQSLNGLIDSGKITPEQAQQLGAGKTISGPNGEIIFLTPQGVFGQSAGGQPQPMSAPQGGIDLFGDGGQQSNAATPQQAEPGQQMGGNIQITEPKVTLDEKKAMTFADRMTTSGAIIDAMGMKGSGKVDRVVSGVPIVGEYLTSDEFKKVDAAKRDFINAQLRRESGAVIADSEFANAEQQYFPQPNDPPEVIEQKRLLRQRVISGMQRDGGPTYTPPEIQTDSGWEEIAPGVRVRKVN